MSQLIPSDRRKTRSTQGQLPLSLAIYPATHKVFCAYVFLVAACTAKTSTFSFPQPTCMLGDRRTTSSVSSVSWQSWIRTPSLYKKRELLWAAGAWVLWVSGENPKQKQNGWVLPHAMRLVLGVMLHRLLLYGCWWLLVLNLLIVMLVIVG